MANVLYAQQKYKLAAIFFRKKYESADCWTNAYASYEMVQENMDNTGICYYKAGMPDSAEYYYNATLAYIAGNEHKFPETPAKIFNFERAVVYYNQAEILNQRKDTAAAEKLFLKSIELSKHTDDSSFIRDLYQELVGIYLATNRVQQAGNLLLDSVHITRADSTGSTNSNYYKLLSAYYIKTNQANAANVALQHAYTITDAIEKRDAKFNAIDVHREFENREQKDLNETLKKDNKIKTSYLLIALIGGCTTFITGLMIWQNLRVKSRYLKRLTFLNEEISKKNDDLQKTLLSLEQSHRENNHIMRIVAHDLKNPISAVRTLVYSLLKRTQSPPNKEVLELIQCTCADSITLIKELLNNKHDLSDISKELVDMGRLTEQCTDLFQMKAGEKKQHLKIQVDYPVIMLNRQKILRVISNIVNNAIKFSPENTDIMIRLQRKDESVLLSVQDNGIGIPAGLKDKIFTLDPVASRVGTAGEESYGLGLSISRKIIEEHEGRLWFESEAGKGSIFYVELPYSVN